MLDLSTPLPTDHIPPYPTQSAQFAAATAYVTAGISILPIAADGSKRPAWGLLPPFVDSSGTTRRPWKPYQSRLPSRDELQAWFGGWGSSCGMAAIAGPVSGGLEILDFDSFDHVAPWADKIKQRAPDVLDRLVMVQTPRPGLHAYYRCAVAGRNQKLAERMVPDPETHVNLTKTLIETRGAGGYALIPPSPSACHPSGRPYIYLTDRDLTSVPTITDAEREILIAAARELDESPPPLFPPKAPPVNPRAARVLDPSRPGDDFELRAKWDDLLRRRGWSYLSTGALGVQHWCRPGKTGATSATINHMGTGLLHIFSSNAAPLEMGRSYSKFAFFAAMECGGDFEAAAAELRKRGYGQAPLAWGKRREARKRHRGAGRTDRRKQRRQT